MIRFWQWVEETFPPDPTVCGPKMSAAPKMQPLQSVLLATGLIAMMISIDLHAQFVRTYASKGDLQHYGGLQLRPYHLNFHKDLGLRGYLEPDPA